MPTHVYNLPQLFSGQTTHFWACTLISDPNLHFELFSCFFNRYHLFLHVLNSCNLSTSTWTHSKASTRVFETNSAFFLLIFEHFRVFQPFFKHFLIFLNPFQLLSNLTTYFYLLSTVLNTHHLFFQPRYTFSAILLTVPLFFDHFHCFRVFSHDSTRFESLSTVSGLYYVFPSPLPRSQAPRFIHSLHTPFFHSFFAFPSSTSRFHTLSTVPRSDYTLTHVYEVPQPLFDKLSIFKPINPILNPCLIPSHFNTFLTSTTCFYVFPTSVNRLKGPDRVLEHPHSF